MPDEAKDILGRYFEVYPRLYAWTESAMVRQTENLDQQDLDAEDKYQRANELLVAIRRAQEGRESILDTAAKVRNLEEPARGARADDQARHDAELKGLCRRDAAHFAVEFFSDYCRLKPSILHRWMYREHNRRAGETIPGRAGRRLAIAAPRGHAKSTIQSLILPIHSIVYQRERYIVILSATLKQSRQRLAAIATQFKHNPALRRLFGEAERMGGVFSAGALEVFGVRIEAYSAGSEFRGLTFGGYRPTHIILDDVEDSESVESADQRDKTLNWFNEVVEHLGNGYTHITAVGTLLHPHSLLAGLLRRPDFKSLRFRSVRAFARRHDLWDQWQSLYTNLRRPNRANEALAFFNEHRREMLDGAHVLWPEKESYYRLMTQQATVGRRAFFQEKQNDPVLAGVALFDPARWRRFRFEGEALILEDAGGAQADRVERGQLRVAGFLDAAMGKGGGDYAALVTVGADDFGCLYVLDAVIERARPSQQAQWVFETAARWGSAVVGLEANCFQELMTLPVEEERKRRRAAKLPWQVAVEPVHPRASKDARIRSLEALVECGALRFARDLHPELIRQMEEYPGRHDDGPDALAGAVELARGLQTAKTPPRRSQRRTTVRLESF